MRFRTLFLFLVLALTAVFALVNWPTFTAPTTLSLVFGTVQAPLGVIMLGLVFLLGAMCLSYLVFVQGTALVDSRRHAKELQVHGDLAENPEASRFTELHNFVNAELRKMEEMQADSRSLLLARIEQMEQRTRTMLQETGRVLEERIEHARPNGAPTH